MLLICLGAAELRKSRLTLTAQLMESSRAFPFSTYLYLNRHRHRLHLHLHLHLHLTSTLQLQRQSARVSHLDDDGLDTSRTRTSSAERDDA